MTFKVLKSIYEAMRVKKYKPISHHRVKRVRCMPVDSTTIFSFLRSLLNSFKTLWNLQENKTFTFLSLSNFNLSFDQNYSPKLEIFIELTDHHEHPKLRAYRSQNDLKLRQTYSFLEKLRSQRVSKILTDAKQMSNFSNDTRVRL